MKFKDIKKKLKRAIAAFFREELLEYVEYNHNIPLMPLPGRFGFGDKIEFEALIFEQVIPIQQGYQNFNIDSDPYEMETNIRRCKEKFARDLMDHIYVDAQDLIKDENFGRRSIRLSLVIQKRKY